MDVTTPEECSPEGNLPAAVPGTELAPGLSRHENAAQHLRRIFYRMGLTDQDIVALSGLSRLLISSRVESELSQSVM